MIFRKSQTQPLLSFSVANLLVGATNLYAFFALPVFAQTVSADTTVGTAITADNGNQQFSVSAGSIRGKSLFHSFDTFSPVDWSVVFDLNDAAYADVNVVIGRVTGQQQSMVNGALEIVGGNSPDLLLINPAGITFGLNARLQLPGSFLASTAESVLLGDDTFSAVNPAGLSLLSVAVPLGLQMGSESKAISYQGSGHSLRASTPDFSPYLPTQLPTGLSVQPGESLSLVGSGLTLQGGVLTAPGGAISLVSSSSGQIGIGQSLEPGFFLNESNAAFNRIDLSGQALLDVSSAAGAGGAENISLHGQDISLAGGWVLWSQNRGLVPSGSTTVEASRSLTIDGQITDANVVSSIVSTALSLGKSSRIDITAPQLSIIKGGRVISQSFGSGEGADVSVKTDNLLVSGSTPATSNVFSQLGASALGSGQAGSLLIAADRISVTEGGYIGTATLFGSGKGGDVRIQANDILVSGVTPSGEVSLIAATSVGGSGDAGNLYIETNRLTATNSGSILTSSFSAGSSGDISIRAVESVFIGGRVAELRSSAIVSGVFNVPPNYDQLLGVLPTPTGDAGRVSIETGRLSVNEHGTVDVANFGTGKAGTLTISAKDTILNSGEITALTASGQGGDIAIATNTLRARGGSVIRATSLSAGNGGNVVIMAPFIIGRENSDIVANAVDGRGGNIYIETQAIFGLRDRPQLTLQSDITASSELGVDGTVEIASTGLDINSGLVELPVYFSDISNQVATSCSSANGNQFVASGRGGLPVSPSESSAITSSLQDLGTTALPSDAGFPTQITQISDQTSDRLPDHFAAHEAVISEATGWKRDHSGQIELVATASSSPTSSTAQCLKKTRSVLLTR